MLPIGLRLRFVIPLACLLVAYGSVHTYLTANSQRALIFSEAKLSTLRLANTVRRSTRHAMLQSRREDVHTMIEEIGEQSVQDPPRVRNYLDMIPLLRGEALGQQILSHSIF